MALLDALFPNDPPRPPARVRVRKAVFPVAGIGSDFLPASKVVARELLPVVDRPLIQYAVDEALAAGIDELIFVTHRSKRAIEDHFDRALELEGVLRDRGEGGALQALRGTALRDVHLSFVRQASPLGLGHAIWCARHLLGDEPFAVVLPDELFLAATPVLRQLIDYHARVPASVVGVMPVAREHIARYGIVAAAATGTRVARVRDAVEKPAPACAPSADALVGRYVFTSTLLECLDGLAPDAHGQLQLTAAISRLAQREPVLAYTCEGERHDCGTRLGWLAAQLACAARHPELGIEFRALLQQAARAYPAGPAANVRPRRLSLVTS